MTPRPSGAGRSTAGGTPPPEGRGVAVPGPVPGPVRRWVLGARPRTLPAAVVPVLVGTATGWLLGAASRGWSVGGRAPGVLPAGPVGGLDGLVWWRAACALVVALAVQVGTNYANDYSDGIRGTDDARVGPLRLVGSGLVEPRSVKAASWAAFAVAGFAGLALAAATTWWLLPVGAACFAAGWLYTGGPRPYGYIGLGELFVFAFFGVVATVGSSFVQLDHVLLPARGATGAVPGFDRFLALWAAIPVGLLATALLEANNLRDLTGDAATGKRTLAVRLGRRRAGWLYVGSIAGAVAGVALVATVRPFALITLLALPIAIAPVRAVLGGAAGRELLPVLGSTGRLQLVMGVLLALGIVL